MSITIDDINLGEAFAFHGGLYVKCGGDPRLAREIAQWEHAWWTFYRGEAQPIRQFDPAVAIQKVEITLLKPTE